jgi:biotin carboxylase
MRHVVLVGGHDGIFEHFHGMSIRFSVLQLPDAIGDHLRALTDEIHPVADLRPDTIIAAMAPIVAAHPPDYIFSFTERGLLAAAVAGRHFDIAGQSVQTCERCLDKRIMRACLAGTEFAVAYRICHTVADIHAFFDAHPDGIVVKDPTGAGSENVHQARDRDQLEHLLTALPEEPFDLLAEEYVGGVEVSVETLTIAGQHRILGITSKQLYRDSLAEQQHLNVPDLLEPHVRDAVGEFCESLLTRIGYEHGPCHIEVKISDNGVRLIEVNNRVGGACIGVLVALTTGVSLFRETLRFLDERPPSSDERRTPPYRFAGTHIFFDPIDRDVLRANLAEVDIHRLVLLEPRSRRNAAIVNEDMLGLVAFASNDRARFDDAVTYLNTHCS